MELVPLPLPVVDELPALTSELTASVVEFSATGPPDSQALSVRQASSASGSRRGVVISRSLP